MRSKKQLENLLRNREKDLDNAIAKRRIQLDKLEKIESLCELLTNSIDGLKQDIKELEK